MAWCSVNFFAGSLGKDASVNVLLPNGQGPFPVLYLLHGISDDHTKWHRHTGLERYLTGRPMIVVMPDGGRSFYLNDARPGGGAYEDHIVKDVVGFVDRVFPTIANRSARAIAGLSMGGYGSLMLAMRHPEMFAAVSAHSSAVFFAHDLKRQGPAGVQDFAATLPPGQYDCFVLAEALAGRQGPWPAIRMDCGTDDKLLDCNREFHAHLQALGVAHQYEEFPGGHNWAYWDLHVQKTLDFAAGHVKS